MGILRAIGSGRTQLSEVAAHAGLPADTSLRDKLERLVWLGYVEKRRNFAAKATAPYRYRLADPAFMFHHRFVARLETALEVNDAAEVWTAAIAPELDTYMGHVFERIAEQAYHRRRRQEDLPLVQEWRRWEGADRSGDSLEIDLVARTVTGAIVTGAVKWNRRPVPLALHRQHQRDLDRLRSSGHRWAHEASEPGSMLVYVAAGGFETGFREHAEADGLPVVCWSLEDLYGA
jgi:hypothetical protein